MIAPRAKGGRLGQMHDSKALISDATGNTQIRAAAKDLRNLRAAIYLAKEVGKGLG